MAHHIYHTRGIILGSVPVKESNRFYHILTDELGLVSASAQSVREHKSKLRYVLQDFSSVVVDLVRGKEFWRITSALGESSYPHMKGDPMRLKLFARACSLTQRLVHGEGREDALLLDMRGALSFLDTVEVIQKHEQVFEVLIAFRMLVTLGYLDPRGYEMFAEPGVWDQEIIEAFDEVHRAIIPRVNEALRVSQL